MLPLRNHKMNSNNLLTLLFLVGCVILGLLKHHGVESWNYPLLHSRKNGIRNSMLWKTTLLSEPMKESVDEGGPSKGVEEYRNAVTKILSSLMQTNDATEASTVNGNAVTVIDSIDFDTPKIAPSTSLETLAAALDYELTEKQWFVTGQVNPAYFSADFEFQDPDVKLKGIEAYSRGVYKLFDQEISKAEIISTVVNTTTSTPDRPVITCTWRLSGGVNIAFGFKIKPYIVYTDFVVDPKTSLIVFQEDRFALPPWDILLRYVFKKQPSRVK
jgi:hypothetical protein